MKTRVLLLIALFISAGVFITPSVTAHATPTIKVEPEICVRSPYAAWPNYVNKTFEVNITVNDIPNGTRFVAADFFLKYNTSLLETISIREGPFFNDSRWNLYGTYFEAIIEEWHPHETGYIKVLNLIWPNLDTGNYSEWTVFPHGRGTLATITFRAIYQPIEPQPSESCVLELSESMLLEWYSGTLFGYISHNREDGIYEVIPLKLPRTPIEVNIDVGTIYFKGEKAEFYILTADYGKAVDATNIRANLYYNGSLFANLTGLIEPVTTGLYRITYTVSADAKPGTYTLLVEAEFFEAKGTNIKSFQISSTLEQLNASIVNLNEINATLIEIVDKVGVINSTIGIIKTSLENLNVTLSNLNSSVESMRSFSMTWLTIASAFSIIAAVAAIVAVVILRIFWKRMK